MQRKLERKFNGQYMHILYKWWKYFNRSFEYKNIARTIHIEIKFKYRHTNRIINGALDKNLYSNLYKKKKKSYGYERQYYLNIGIYSMILNIIHHHHPLWHSSIMKIIRNAISLNKYPWQTEIENRKRKEERKK